MQGRQRLLEEGHRLLVRRVGERLGTGLPEVSDRLLPHLAADGMVSQALDLLGEPIGVQRLDGLDDPGMQRAPTLLEHARVGDLVADACLKVYSTSGKTVVS